MPSKQLQDHSSTQKPWTYNYGGFSLKEGGIRNGATVNHGQVHKLEWENANQARVSYTMENTLKTMIIAEINPQLATRHLLMLAKNNEFFKAASFITRMNSSVFKRILMELPIDDILKSIPQSLPVYEVLCSKIMLTNGMVTSMRMLKPEAFAMQLVKFYADCDDIYSAKITLEKSTSIPVTSLCRSIFKIIAISEPRISHMIRSKRQVLIKVTEGLGNHGLVYTSDRCLMDLRDALKIEVEKASHAYKMVGQKLEEFCLASKTISNSHSINRGPAPIKASHQRQLSLKLNDIQERLRVNKSILELLQSIMQDTSLIKLLEILHNRVESDKEALVQFLQFKREVRIMEPNSMVAPVLMRFSKGCDHVLHILRDVEDGQHSSGYHSDSDSVNVIGRKKLPNSIRSGSRASGSRSLGSSTESQPQDKTDSYNKTTGKYKNTDSIVSHGSNGPNLEMNSMNNETECLKRELMKAQQTILAFQEREKKLKDRLAEQAQRVLEMGRGYAHFENISLGDKRPTALIRRYGNLYAQARVDTLDALDNLPELQDAEELKSKLLFSVIVLAFRSVINTLQDIKEKLKRILQMPDASDPLVMELETCISLYLKKTVDRYDVAKNVEEVCSQIWATLYDYPCLKTCDNLIKYICDSVKLAWGLSNQTPPFCIEYETRHFRQELHVRFHASNHDADQIKTYLWPALLERDKGPCVHKGVVVT